MKGQYRTADGKAQIDWELTDKEHGPAFSACGEYDGGCGQCLDHIAEDYPDDRQLQRIVEVWKDYHLNDTTAGLPEQEAEIRRRGAEITDPLWKEAPHAYAAKVGFSSCYDMYCRWLEEADKLQVNIPENAKALGGFGNQDDLFWEDGQSFYRSEPAPMDARYTYGRRWIYSPIPGDVLEEIEGWANQPARRPLHLDQAQAFLDEHGLKLRATYKGDKCPPWCDGKCNHGDRYRITISRKSQGRLSFDFWNSQKDMEEGADPTAYSVLACISSDAYCPDTLKEFCGNYGYDEDNRKAAVTFKQCSTFAERIQAFFTGEELEALTEIS